jgi:hypothetical protein
LNEIEAFEQLLAVRPDLVTLKEGSRADLTAFVMVLVDRVLLLEHQEK